MPSQDQIWNDYDNQNHPQDDNESPDLHMELDVRVVTFFDEHVNL